MKATACADCNTPKLVQLRKAGDPASGVLEVPKLKGGMSAMGTACTFFKTGACSEAIMNVVDRAFDNPMPAEERGVMPLAGGIAARGYQCGMLWGATLAAGAHAQRSLGAGALAETAAMTAAARVVQSFQESNGQINCLELTETDWTQKLQMLRYFIKGGPVSCVLRAVAFAPIAFDQIESAIADTLDAAGVPADPDDTASRPLSCAAALAKKVGLSDEHATMAAGLAGGIGLSGGACGALGAAIWILGVHHGKDHASFDEVNAKAGDTIERFMQVSDFEFECSEIVGRRFDGIDDHACHLRNGGCWKIIETLAASVRDEIERTTDAIRSSAD